MKKKIQKFNLLNIFAKLKNFEAKDEGGTIVTYIGGMESARWTPKTSNYLLINFKDIAKEFVKQVKDHMDITNYELRIYGGVQELKLYGAEYEMFGEVYQKMATLLSSTDGTRNMKVNFGLFRQICTNGMMAKEAGEDFNARHLNGNERLQEIMKFDFGDIESAFGETETKITELREKNINLMKIRDGIIDEKGRNSQKFLAFVQKLISSKTDRLETLTPDQMKNLKSGSDLLKKNNKFDLEIPAYQAFQCYTELFRAHDSGVMAKESTRLLELV